MRTIDLVTLGLKRSQIIMGTGGFVRSRVVAHSNAELTFPRLNHVARHFEINNIHLSPIGQKLLLSFVFKKMDERYSRRQFATLTSLFIPFEAGQTQDMHSSLSHILGIWEINPEEVSEIEMSYINSGDHKSAYKFEIKRESNPTRAFVVGIDKDTGWFKEKHSELEFKFLAWAKKKKPSFSALPNLLGYTTFSGTINGKREKYSLIIKEFIEGQTAESYLKLCVGDQRGKAIYQIGFELGRFVEQFGGYPNDFHLSNIIISEQFDGQIIAVFNDILGVIKNPQIAGSTFLLPLLIDDVKDDYVAFFTGFSDGAGKRGIGLLNVYFRAMSTSPIVLMGNDNGLIEKFELFKKGRKK